MKIFNLKVLKRGYIPAEIINRNLTRNPDSRKRIGSLPYDWIRKFGKERISGITEQVDDVFERFSTQINNLSDLNHYALCKNNTNLLNAQIFFIKMLKEILKRSDINISYIGSGAFKHCHKLDIGNYSYAFSTFKSEESMYTNCRNYFNKNGQGKGNEPQAIFTLYRHAPHGHTARPFLARLSGENDSGGYILSKFIDQNHSAKNNFGAMELRQKTFLYTDPNFIRGICIEAGGCLPNQKYIKDKELRGFLLRIAKIIDNHAKFLRQNPINIISQQYIINKKEAGKDIFHLETGGLSRMQQKSISKILRTLGKIRHLKEVLIKNGKYEIIKELLNRDMADIFPYDEYSREFGSPDSIYIYPQLIADEFGISNVPDLETMISISAKYFDREIIPFVKYYTKEEVESWLKNNYVPERDKQLLKNLCQQYGKFNLPQEQQ